MVAAGRASREPGRGTAGRRLRAASAVVLALLLAACAAPQTGAPGAAADPASARGETDAPTIAAAPAASPAPVAESPPRGKPAPPMSDPLPAERVPDARPAPAMAPKPDVSCRTHADCVVKDVGNCCGYYPRCVNAKAAVDPQAVQAQCARSGMASVCGFKTVEGCECVQGECRDKSTALDVQ